MDEKCLSEIETLPILIVDDSTSYRLLLMRHIKAWGEYTLLQAEDGEQALEIIKSRRVGIIISDWEMPNINGLDLCKAVREFSHLYIYSIASNLWVFALLPRIYANPIQSFQI